jgi:3,4-dihydroxy 2-butanone 4-phosphate synthase/GTP cyclohydrolase II
MAPDGGVLMRAGHTEAGCDLARHGRACSPSSVICEIMKDDGTMAPPARPGELRRASTGSKIGTIADLHPCTTCRQREPDDEPVGERPARRGPRTGTVPIRDKPSQSPHLALVFGELHRDGEALVRVHEPVSILDLIERPPHHRTPGRCTSEWPRSPPMAAACW